VSDGVSDFIFGDGEAAAILPERCEKFFVGFGGIDFAVPKGA
jgi:hypothetical protein